MYWRSNIRCRKRGLDSAIYGTIGTGIGFGVYLGGRLIHGLMHTETGHILLQKHELDKDFIGSCPYHTNCFETLASGPSIEKRYGKKAEYLIENKEIWELKSYYIGQALCDCIMSYFPKKNYFRRWSNAYSRINRISKTKKR